METYKDIKSTKDNSILKIAIGKEITVIFKKIVAPNGSRTEYLKIFRVIFFISSKEIGIF